MKTVTEQRCRGCGYTWIPRTLGVPLRCPSCGKRRPTEPQLVAECRECGATWHARKRKVLRCEECYAPNPKVRIRK